MLKGRWGHALQVPVPNDDPKELAVKKCQLLDKQIIYG